jgi:hypothetical protein
VDALTGDDKLNEPDGDAAAAAALRLSPADASTDGNVLMQAKHSV